MFCCIPCNSCFMSPGPCCFDMIAVIITCSPNNSLHRRLLLPISTSWHVIHSTPGHRVVNNIKQPHNASVQVSCLYTRVSKAILSKIQAFVSLTQIEQLDWACICKQMQAHEKVCACGRERAPLNGFGCLGYPRAGGNVARTYFEHGFAVEQLLRVRMASL
jgi:hypothetical protein